MSEQKIALVTGASRGIGKAVALALAATGMTVIGTATSEKGAQSIAAYLDEAGFSGHGWVLDISDSASVDAALKTIATEVGTPTVLVNNAGITQDNLMMRMKEEEWDKVINTNLTGIFRVTKGLLKGMMKARWGRIITVGSVVGTTGNSGQTNYAAAKAGVIGFSKSLAQEIASRNITVNVVAPGFIETDMTQVLPEDVKASILAGVPLSRLGQPEEIAATVNFLASDAAGYITGETIHVNGGMNMS